MKSILRTDLLLVKSTKLDLIVRYPFPLSLSTNQQTNLIKTGWMTAELFTKLSVKLYSERDTSDNDSTTSSNLIDASSSDNEDPGGALLHSPDTSSGDGNLPGEWHAREMNRSNPFSLLDSLVEDNGSSSEDEGEAKGKNVGLFVPRFGGRFWDVYMNKLRVNAAEVGVCDLSEGVDEL